MSVKERTNRLAQIVGLGIIGLIVLLGVSIALSYLSPRPVTETFYYNPFFPFRLGWVGGIILILIVFWVARWFLWPWRRREDYYSPRYRDGDAEVILKERYAKGEITKEQFEQMLSDLRKS
jgi:putative membrane protein